MDTTMRDRLMDLMKGDEEAIRALAAEDFVQEWPQSNERIRGRDGCLNVMRNYPGGPPEIEFGRVSGEGDHWVVESTTMYPDGDVYHVASILEFRDGQLIRQVDYFGPEYPAPDWRKEWVEPIA